MSIFGGVDILGDIILLVNGNSCYVVGKIVGDYEYCPGSPMSHRRKVEWSSRIISRAEMSDDLRHSSGSIGTCCDLTKYSEELLIAISLSLFVHKHKYYYSF